MIIRIEKDMIGWKKCLAVNRLVRNQWDENDWRIVKLLIPSGTRVHMSQWCYVQKKARAAQAKVISIYEAIPDEKPMLAFNSPDFPGIHSVKLGKRLGKSAVAYSYSTQCQKHDGPGDASAHCYRPGKLMRPCLPFDMEDTRCASGIHFFLKVADALEYDFS